MKKNEELNNQEVLDIKDQQPQEQQQQEQPKEQPKEQKIEMDVEQLKQWMVTEEGKRFLQPILDRHFSKGLETWKGNNLEKMIEAEIEKRYPTDPQAKQIKELQDQLRAREIHEVAVSTLAQYEIDPSLGKFFIGQTVEETKAGLESFNKVFQKAVRKEVDSRLKTMGGTPKAAPIHYLTKEEVSNLDYNQRVQLYLNDPYEFRRIMGD